MGADKRDVYDSAEWVRDMMAKPKSWLVDYLRNTLRSSAPSASHNSQSDAIALLNEAVTRLGELDSTGSWWSAWTERANAVDSFLPMKVWLLMRVLVPQ